MSAAGPVARENVTIRELDGETLVYDLNSHDAHCLNETSAAVWRRCDGATPPARIAAELGCEEEVVWLALEQLWKLDLLEGEAAPERARSLSRRRLLKTALIALPVAVTIAAPTAAQAVTFTCSPQGGPCGDDTDCCPDATCTGQGGIVVCDLGECACAATG